MSKSSMKSRPKSLPNWDLERYFSGPTDPRLQIVTRRARVGAIKLEKKYRGKLSKLGLKPAAIREALANFEAVLIDALKPMEYAYLLFAADCQNPTHGALLQQAKSDYLLTRNFLRFLELEIVSMDSKAVKKLIASPLLARYRHYLENVFAGKPYRLPEREEKICEEKQMTGAGAFMRLFDEELSLKKFKVKIGGKTKLLSETETLELLNKKSRAERKAGADGLTAGLNEEARRLTFITNTLADDHALNDRLRGFETPEAARHLGNEISQEMVDTMSSVVEAGYPVSARYYNYKRKLIGLSKLYEYDRYAPIAGVERNIPWDTAKRWILESFGRFSPGYAEIAKKFFDERWIDAAPRPGKRGGAFCSYTTPDHHPYILMNYSGSVREVFTLAHELGHGIHGYLFRDRGVLSADTPITVAETASIFAEMLLFDYLKTEISDTKELRSLYCSKIESTIGAVFRQIAIYRFEQDVHRARRAQGELTTETINQFWHDRNQAMFGSSVTLRPEYGIWWSYIPHCIHSPFYVYAYAFGELLTLSLYARYLKEGKGFVDKYIGLLAAGGSKSPKELLAPFKIDLTKREFWEGGIKVIDEMLGELVSLRSN